jgi:hypothetical protein
MQFVRCLGIASIGGVALCLVACIRDIPCEETQTCRSSLAGDGATSDSATEPDGAPLSCPADRGDCDHAAFNGCEVDLAMDPLHCGACGKPCDGVCRAKVCQP